MKVALSILALLAGAAVLSQGGAVSASDDFAYDGVAQPSRVIHLGAASEGLIALVNVDRGDRVQVGQVLAQLDVAVPQANADLARARAQGSAARRVIEAKIADSRRRLAQYQALMKDGFRTSEEVDLLQTELSIEELNLASEEEAAEIQRLEVVRAEALVQQGTMESPINGVVFERFLSPGEYYSKSGSEPVLTLAQLDPLHVEVHVPVDLFGDIAVGGTAMVQLDAPGNPTTTGRVQVKDSVVDAASRTFRVRLEIPNPENQLPSGLRCRIRFGQ
ncbi:MAG: efflux RND transporter periplasmic adaptor subunit [Planctomycetota bacterium]|nr:efflux RND transporter periplasmic adaptor subunit [Planctomycetota bacterium]